MTRAEPYFETKLGAAYLGDSLNLLPKIPNESVDLIVTSPPFALLRQKKYGNVACKDYSAWFVPFARQFHRVLKPAGSFVMDIGGTWLRGKPVRSLYHFELVLTLCRPPSDGGAGFHLAQDLYWFNPSKLPTPAEWVTVRRVRVKDAVNPVWWFSKTENPKADNRGVLVPYSESQKQLMKNGYRAKARPSGHDISTKFGLKDNGGAIPPNLITAANTSSNDSYLTRCKSAGIEPHPARFPEALPAFAINLCTSPGDVVLDPFAGSLMTARAAENLGRKWTAFELEEEYLKGGRLRFDREELRAEV